MNARVQSLDPGLYFVATPIGTARDITLRALDILASADVLAAEDTRNTRRLLDLHGVALNGRPLIPYHDHNGPQQRPKLLAMIEDGKSVAYVSDAGTPLVADPGYALARAAIAEGLSVTSAPGASALLAALSVAGLPTDRFWFAGFPPPKAKARRAALAEAAAIPGTLVWFESAKRVHDTLSDMVITFGGDRPAALCRELTKKFEEARRGTLDELVVSVAADPPRGEIVLVVGAGEKRTPSEGDLRAALTMALRDGGTMRDAVDRVATETGAPRRVVYALALKMEKDT